MKNKYLLAGIIIFALASCNIRNSDKNGDTSDNQVTARLDVNTTVRVIDSTFNFGKIKEGEKVVFSYRFQNSGEYPLVVTSAKASCGCTVPEKPEQPVAPGETAYIKIVFNSKGTGGVIHKEVQVASNAQPGFPILTLEGEVVNE